MFISVYITCKNLHEAKSVSMHLLDKRLVACCNIFPVESMYWWEGDINFEKEFALVSKALKKNFKKILSEVKTVHSYKNPCIVSYDISEGSPDFLKWVKAESEKNPAP
jgi:periplasmic divalent cation tolerance protein